MPHAIFRLNSTTRSLALFAADAAIASLSLWIAYLLRFDGSLPDMFWRTLPVALPLLLLARLITTVAFRLNRWSFRYSGLLDGFRIALASLAGTGFFVLGLYLIAVVPVPRSVVILELLMTTMAMAALRFAPRLLWTLHGDIWRMSRGHSTRTLILGAGSAGEMLLRELRGSGTRAHNYYIVGFVDDDHRRLGDVVGGKSVLGTSDDLPKLVERYDVDQLLIAIPNLPAQRIRSILNQCSNLKLKFKILPISYVYLEERDAARLLQDLSPEDILHREVVDFNDDESTGELLGERPLMVVGAAGSIGSEVCRQLLEYGGRRLLMVDINENSLYMMQRRFEQEFPEALIQSEVANIRDVARIQALFSRYRPCDVFHAAARKHVPLMENAPCEAVKTNVLGTRHLVRAAHETRVERFVFMSTDKAVRPTSIMGASKRLGEEIIRAMDPESPTKFSVVRFGNVLDSAGSVVPVFREQIEKGGPVTVTHPEMRRFFMTISEAVGLVLRAAYGDYGTLCVLEMGEQIRILDLARHMITMSGKVPDHDIAIHFTGLRPGEKLFEELIAQGEEVVRVIDRKIRVVRGNHPRPDLDEQLDRLEQASVRDDSEAVRILLQETVVDFHFPILDSDSVDLVDLDGVDLDGAEIAEDLRVM